MNNNLTKDNLAVSKCEMYNILNNPGVIINNYKYIRPDNKKRDKAHSISCSISLGSANQLNYEFIEPTQNGYGIWRGGHQASIVSLCRQYEKPFKKSVEEMFSQLGCNLKSCYSDVEIKNNELFIKLWATSNEISA